ASQGLAVQRRHLLPRLPGRPAARHTRPLAGRLDGRRLGDRAPPARERLVHLRRPLRTACPARLLGPLARRAATRAQPRHPGREPTPARCERPHTPAPLPLASISPSPIGQNLGTHSGAAVPATS